MSQEISVVEKDLKLDGLPDDVLFAILAFCDVKTLLAVACVNRNLNRVSSHDTVWRRIGKSYINIRKSDKKSESWKDLCRVSLNWVRGYCKDRCMLKFKSNFMPCICLTEPNKLLVSQGPDIMMYQSKKKTRMLPLWQIQKGFHGHQFDVTHFITRGDQLISSSLDNTLRTWNMLTGMCEAVYTGHTSNVHAVDGYGDILVSGGRDKVVKVWSQHSQHCLHTIPVQDHIWCVGMNPITRSVLSGTAGHHSDVPAIQLWSLESGSLISNLDDGCHRFGAGVLSVLWESAFTFLSCGYDTAVKFWDMRINSKCACVLKWEDPHDSTVYCIDSDNKWMIVSGTNRYGVARVWDKRVRKCLRSFYAGRNSFSPVYSIQFDRTSLFVALANGKILSGMLLGLVCLGNFQD